MSSSPRAIATACWLGSVPYRRGWELQGELVDAIRSGGAPDTLLFLEHPHVYTAGKRGGMDHVLWDQPRRQAAGVELVASDRGGDVTYHGPGQLVGYPVFDLRRLGVDLLDHIHGLERSLIGYLAEVGVDAEPGGAGLTGVWADGAKVAAIGVKLSGSVVSHGFALNLTTDLSYFDGIVGCGLEGRRATSVERLTGRSIRCGDAARVRASLRKHVRDEAGVATCNHHLAHAGRQARNHREATHDLLTRPQGIGLAANR